MYTLCPSPFFFENVNGCGSFFFNKLICEVVNGAT
jgi:hypothetical protein